MKTSVQQSKTKICRQAFPLDVKGTSYYIQVQRNNTKIGGGNKRESEMKSDRNPEMCLQKQHFLFPNIPPSLGCLGRHAALRGPHNHSPEEATFDQCGKGSRDLMMHFRQPEVLEHSVLN